MQRGLRVVLGVESDIEFGLSQSQAKQFALAGAVIDQENGGVGHHTRRKSVGNVLGSKRKRARCE
jgi:hypothetical protein